MNPEKEIVSWWLHKKGFFTISSIKAPHNKEIELLAIKIEEGTVDDVWHVELACSVSSIDNIKPQEYLNRFDDDEIQKKVNDSIKNHLGRETKYKKILVIGATSNLREFKKLGGIEVLEFGNILNDVFLRLDKQNYRNITLRTLQLLKYLTLSDPQKLATLLNASTTNKILKLGTRERFIKNLLHDAETLRILAKPEFESLLVRILATSGLKSPEKLAKVIHESVLTKNTRKRFLETTLELNNVEVNEELAHEIEAIKERPLGDFM